MKISRLAAVIATAGLLVCACFAAEAINKQDLIDCGTVGHTQSGVPCPGRGR